MSFKRRRAQAVRSQNIVDASIRSFDALINRFEPPLGVSGWYGLDKGDGVYPTCCLCRFHKCIDDFFRAGMFEVNGEFLTFDG